jgi:predicted ATPase/DNA-binding winged helix-turn-helix (wHTH) protein
VENKRRIVFDRFCLDLANESLQKGSRAIKLRPKAFTVLAYLLERPGQLVTKEDLLNCAWPGVFVGDAVLKVAIKEIREALGDDPAYPQFIETAHRRGYRFIGRIDEAAPQAVAEDAGSNRSVGGAFPLNSDSPQPVVGRDEALSRMRNWLEKALGGERQIVFVTGEAGIGKTAFTDAFVRSVASDRSVRVARGQCLEQYGTGEAYLPVLEAIGRLCRGEPQIVDLLRSHAPMWLLQLPSLMTASDRDLFARELFAASRERMLREMVEALESLTAEDPLVLILEDLHWADYSTIDLISYLARQRQSAQIMLIGTYRPVELIVSGHPLKGVKRELLAKRQCEEVQLDYLGEKAIAQYLSLRFPSNRFPEELSTLIHKRTEGNPLFMVNVVDYLVAEKLIDQAQEEWGLLEAIENVDVGVPDSIKGMIEKQLDHLHEDEHRILQTASAVGSEFSTVAVAAALGREQTAVDSRCDELVRQHRFIQDLGIQDFPGGDPVPRFGFIHALYQNVLYEGLPAARRIELHRRIGEHTELLYGERAREIAAELAMHFERAADYTQAVKYLQQAAENAIRRFAYREASGLSRRGLELICKLPETLDRSRRELALQVSLGVPLIATEGYAAADVENTYTRARELCRQLGDAPEISQVLWGLWTFHLVRSELWTAREDAEEFLRAAPRVPYAELAMEVTLIHLGELAPAIEHFEKALLLYDPEAHREDVFRYSQNAAVAARTHAAWALWSLGHPDQALTQIEHALALAQETSEPHGLTHTLFFGAIVHQLRREPELSQQRAEQSIEVANEHGLMLYQGLAAIARGWALAEQGRHGEGIEQIRQGLAGYQATGTELVRPQCLALLAEALSKGGRSAESLHVVEEALDVTERNGDRYYQAELYRLKGELLLARPAGRVAQATRGQETFVETDASPAARAEQCFNQAIDIARQQKARSLELRAAISLAHLFQTQGRRSDACSCLAPIYEAFTEGSETTDMRKAKALLDELQGPDVR